MQPGIDAAVHYFPDSAEPGAELLRAVNRLFVGAGDIAEVEAVCVAKSKRLSGRCLGHRPRRSHADLDRVAAPADETTASRVERLLEDREDIRGQAAVLVLRAEPSRPPPEARTFGARPAEGILS